MPDALSLSVHLSGKLIGSTDTIICGVDLNWHSCTHSLNLKI